MLGRGRTVSEKKTFRCVLFQLGLDTLQLFVDCCVWPHLISAFVAELRSLARDCDFGRALEVNLRDKLVCAVADQVLQQKLLTEKDLTFERALDVALSHELAKKNLAT